MKGPRYDLLKSVRKNFTAVWREHKRERERGRPGWLKQLSFILCTGELKYMIFRTKMGVVAKFQTLSRLGSTLSLTVWIEIRNLLFWIGTSNYLILWRIFRVGVSKDVPLTIAHFRTHHKGKKLPSAHVLGDFNFKDIDWPDRLSKSGSTLSQSEGQILIDIMNDHGLEQMVHFPTREKNTLDLILTTLPGQFQDVHSPDKLSDHDIVSGTLKIFIPPIKKPRRKVYLYQKGDYESMRKDTLEFAKEKYFNGHSDTRSVQENFDLLTSFIQDSADKHIPSKTSRSVSSIPWITP